MGGGAEVIYLNWCWGGGEQVSWADRIASSKKMLWGASPIMPPHMGKMACPHVERKDCPHKKYPHRGNSPPPTWIFLFMFHFLASAYIPLACADYDLHSLYSVCLRELEKKSTKIKAKQKFSGSFI